VTGTDEQGRSCVVSDGAPPGAGGFAELWLAEPGEPLAAAASAGGPPARLEPEPGAAKRVR
jgi:hypothetical protein